MKKIKQKKEKPEREKKTKSPKEATIKTGSGRKIMKILLWIILIFIFVKGVFAIINDSSMSEMKKDMDDYLQEVAQEETYATGAKSFAENFIREYYTFTGTSNSTYVERVTQYTASGLDIKEPVGTTSAEVLNADAVSMDILSSEKFNVTVLTNVQYTSLVDGAVTSKNLTLQVPVAQKDGSYAIDDLPQIRPHIKKADVNKASGYSGSEVDSKEKAEMRTMLENFLKAYYEGNASELSYYVTKEFPYTYGLEGLVQFERISHLFITYDVVELKYNIGVTCMVNDNGQNLEQHLYLSAIKDGDKYFINEINARAVESEDL